jgi:protein-serine/threonine kinase
MPTQQQQQQQQQYQPSYTGQQPMPSHHQDFAQGYGGQGRSNTPGASNDPNTGLAHQFSHQNLGGAGGYGSRGASPAGASRPRTAGGSGQAPNYSYLNAPMPNQASSKVSSADFEVAPERNPDKYGTNANNNQKKCSQLAADFFKDSVKRARERNQR